MVQTIQNASFSSLTKLFRPVPSWLEKITATKAVAEATQQEEDISNERSNAQKDADAAREASVSFDDSGAALASQDADSSNVEIL